MKRVLALCIAFVLSLSAAPALAADIHGTWIASLDAGGNGTIELIYTFKQDGDKLTGSIDIPQSDRLIITEGKLDGDKVTFTVSYNGEPVSHTGTLSAAGDTIKLTLHGGPYDGVQLVLKREPPPTTPAPAT